MGMYAPSKAATEALARGFAADVDQSVGVVDPVDAPAGQESRATK
jgi:hypothetical protein